MDDLHLSIGELACLYLMAAHVRDNLTAALEGKPAELLRRLVLDLDEMETLYGSVDGALDYESMADAIADVRWKTARVDDDGNLILGCSPINSEAVRKE